MKFNTEITVVQPATGEHTKWQGPQIEADTIQEAEKAAFASIVYVSGQNVPREQLSIAMQPPRSLSVVKSFEPNQDLKKLWLVGDSFNNASMTGFVNGIELSENQLSAILRLIGYQCFDPLDPETIRMKNEKLFTPDFISKLDEAESIGGVVISYLPEV